jgi:hypothetical protein
VVEHDHRLTGDLVMRLAVGLASGVRRREPEIPDGNIREQTRYQAAIVIKLNTG